MIFLCLVYMYNVVLHVFTKYFMGLTQYYNLLLMELFHRFLFGNICAVWLNIH